MTLGDYPNLKKALEEGRLGEILSEPVAPREPRCGPWVDGICQKCGARDSLDLLDFEIE